MRHATCGHVYSAVIMMPSSSWIESVRAACREAGRAILALRAPAPAGITHKADGSPVTDADRAASTLLRARLEALEPGVPVVCEEGGRDPGGSARYWLVDPLDGTREFVRGGELFTVNVALIEAGRPVFGLVHAPVGGECWWGAGEAGAFRDGVPIRARALPPAPAAARILLSPSESTRHPGRLLAALLDRLPGAQCCALPGAIKFCRLAEGSGDAYPRATPSCAWDSAAGQAIVEAAGGAVLGADGQPVRYAPAPGWLNGEFLAVADARHDWRAVFTARDGS